MLALRTCVTVVGAGVGAIETVFFGGGCGAVLAAAAVLVVLAETTVCAAFVVGGATEVAAVDVVRAVDCVALDIADEVALECAVGVGDAVAEVTRDVLFGGVLR